MGATAPRRLLPAFLITLLLILTTAYYVASLKDAVPSPRDLVSTVGDRIKGALPDTHKDDEKPLPGASASHSASVPAPTPTPATTPVKTPPNTKEHGPHESYIPEYSYENAATAESEKGEGKIGTHFHIRPSSPTKEKGVEGCEYPVMIHTSADKHCTGTLALYASIVRNTLTQPEALKGKTCVHFTYVDPEIKTFEEMYKWTAKKNPFTAIEDCAKLDTTPALNDLVPVRWHALKPIEKPQKMQIGKANWLGALNKVHSWGFDLYPRILIMDADSFVLTDLHNIFLETPLDVTIAGAPDQFSSCHDRNRINGGLILLGQPGRYFHTVMAELLHDPGASCLSGHWQQSEQELLNCFCGYNYGDRPVLHPPRPEFSCKMMPIYNSVWPRNYGCSDVNVQPIRSIHFTAVTKPWNVPEEKLDSRWDIKFWKCLRDAGRDNDVEMLKTCVIPELEYTRNFGDDVPKPPLEVYKEQDEKGKTG